MSIQSQIDRINENVSSTYAVLSEAGADVPTLLNTDNLAATASSIKAVLYNKEQTLTREQRIQARANIGISGAVPVTDYGAKGDGNTDDTVAFQNALAENRVVYVPGGTYSISDTLLIRANCELELSHDTVLQFTQTDKPAISMLRLANLKGNHATVFVPYTFDSNVINCDGGDDYAQLDPDNINNSNATAVPPFKKWDPQWKMSRYITDINICKINSSGFHYSDSGDCYGTAVYIHNNIDDYPVSYMWGVNMSGVRIAGGFNYGIRLHNIGDHVKCWNHDARIEAVIDACKIGVSVENAYYNRLAVTIQPRKAADNTAYAEHGIQIIDSKGTDLSSTRIWDWMTKDSETGKTIHTKWEIDNEFQHIAMYGDCRGVILDDFIYYASETYDVRDLIYTDTPSNLEKMIILQEPIDRWFKVKDGNPYFSAGITEKKLISQDELDYYFDVDAVKSFDDVLPKAIDTDGSLFNNGAGYIKNGYTLSGNGAYISGPGYGVTGFIKCKPGDTIYVHDLHITDSQSKIALYKGDYSFVFKRDGGNLVTDGGSGYYYEYTETTDGFSYYIKSVSNMADVEYVRITFQSSQCGENPMVSVNEEIKYAMEGFLSDSVKVKGNNVVLSSSNGKNYLLSVADDGTLTTTPMT